MFRFLLCCCIVPVFAALPVIGDNAVGYENIKNSTYNGQEVPLAFFKLINGDGEESFVMKITFPNGTKLKDNRYVYTIPLTTHKLRYKDINGVWVEPPISLNLTNLNTIEFSKTKGNLQANYEFQLLGSWNKLNAERIAGTFKESAIIEILPYP